MRFTGWEKQSSTKTNPQDGEGRRLSREVRGCWDARGRQRGQWDERCLSRGRERIPGMHFPPLPRGPPGAPAGPGQDRPRTAAPAEAPTREREREPRGGFPELPAPQSRQKCRQTPRDTAAPAPRLPAPCRAGRRVRAAAAAPAALRRGLASRGRRAAPRRRRGRRNSRRGGSAGAAR